ncbi:MAG: tryptophan synthase subunit alpha [Lachnospiraceae bacterium]|nr:tryptophan synthase subunit alpha [Lachnospiraceae bacterium]
MNRIADAFHKHKAFIAFITVGDPDLETTEKVVHAAVDNGADLIELGIPFSDPTAEGPVIMHADNVALSAGTTTDKVFALTEKLRGSIKTPLVYMTYANVVFSYGTEKFAEKAAAAGIDGIILPDVPYEEKDEFDSVFSRYGIDLISMIAPTSENRIAMIAKEAKGFLYMVSSLGVTGTRAKITTDIGAMTKVVKANTKIPCAVGFGISTPEQAAKMAACSDGAIVGSAIIKIIDQYGKDAAPHVGEYVKSMADAVHGVAAEG